MLAFIFTLAVVTNVQRVETRFVKHEQKQLVPMLQEVVRFPTYAGNAEVHAAQKAWLAAKAKELGFVSRDAGKITEIELPANTPNAPVLGLVVHGDVQAVEADRWTFPPFSGKADAQYVYGRGAADDKGPLVQALLAMKALKESGIVRTSTVRLLVGSEEESAAGEMPEYVKTHAPPYLSLVLDSEFPVIVGEKAWNALSVASSPTSERGLTTLPYRVEKLTAGLGPSIVPDHAELVLRWRSGAPDWTSLTNALKQFAMPDGTTLELKPSGETLELIAHGRSAHAGVNLQGGRNALVGLARAIQGRLPEGGADDLLAFARIAGLDFSGSGLDITDKDPVWGTYAVNVATIAPVEGKPDQSQLVINIRRTPPRTGQQLREHLNGVVARFNERTGASLAADGFYDDEPLGFRTDSKIVVRLLDVYEQATGERAKPAISGGGTYAKRLPNAIAFGMWFPGKPYPGHDVDEKNPIADLVSGTKVLIHALVDLATGPPIEKPFEP